MLIKAKVLFQTKTKLKKIQGKSNVNKYLWAENFLKPYLWENMFNMLPGIKQDQI